MNNEMLNGETRELTIGELDAVTGGAGVIDTIRSGRQEGGPSPDHRHHRSMHRPLVLGLSQSQV